MYDLDTVVDGFLTTAIWADLSGDDDSDGEHGCDDPSVYSVAADSRVAVTAMLRSLLAGRGEELWGRCRAVVPDYSCSDFGHTLWLSGRGHGVSFRDDFSGELADALEALADDSRGWPVFENVEVYWDGHDVQFGDLPSI